MTMEIKDLHKDPNRFGFPTLEQYSKNPQMYRDRFMGKDSDVFDIISNGSTLKGIRKATNSVKYKILQYETRSLEEVERIALENGMHPRDLTFIAEIRNTGGQRGEQIIRVLTKEEYERRKSW